MTNGRLYDSISVFIISISVVLPQIYLAQNPQVNLDSTFFLLAVILPTILASVLFIPRRRWILFYAFLALIFPVTEDAPVYLDSVFTWPEVTSGFQHIFLELLFHGLTILFMYLALREATRFRTGRLDLPKIFILTSLAFVASYAQNIPLEFIHSIVIHSWYTFDLIEHILSILLLYLAVRVAKLPI